VAIWYSGALLQLLTVLTMLTIGPNIFSTPPAA
jgi:hypothetical protein